MTAAVLAGLIFCGCAPGAAAADKKGEKSKPPPITAKPPAHAWDGCLDWMLQVMANSKWRLENDPKFREYECVFKKEEKLPAKDNEWYGQVADMKFRYEPFGVWLDWTSGKNKGYTVSYMVGKRAGKMKVQTPFLISVEKLPNAKDVMEWTRHPITNIGMRTMATRMLGQCKLSKKLGHDGHTKLMSMSKVSGRVCYKILRQPPAHPGYYGKKSIMYIDKEWLVPVRVEVWDKKGDLVEKYTYENIKWGPKHYSDKDLDT